MNVFISYSTDDKDEAAILHDALSLLGFKCFLAHRDIETGSPWRDAIMDELKDADVFIPLLSEKGLASAWVHQESGMAHLLRTTKKKLLILPGVVAGPPPGCLSIYQAVRLTSSFRISKLESRMDISLPVAMAFALPIAKKAKGLSTEKSHSITRLATASDAQATFILEFLHKTASITFDEFLRLIDSARASRVVFRSDASMWYMYRLMERHSTDLKMLPEWVKAWNELHKWHVEHKAAEEKRRAEEAERYRQLLTEQRESMVKAIKEARETA